MIEPTAVTPSVTAQITAAAVTWLSKPFSVMVVTELTERSYWSDRLDVVAVMPNTKHIVVVEVKASRADFLRGRDKVEKRGKTQFEKYLAFCNQLYIAAPKGMVEKSEVPAGIGLINVYESGKARLSKRAARRDVEPTTYLMVLERVMQKLIVEGHRWSQETTWRKQREEWEPRRAFRDWLRAHENGGRWPPLPRSVRLPARRTGRCD
jgi:hypothetical protein